MSPRIPDIAVPVLFTAGETVKFRRLFDDYQGPTDWTYTIYFNGPSAVFHKQAVWDNGFVVTLTPTDLTVPAGIYRYIERVVNTASSPTGEVYTVGEGVSQIELDLATASAGAALTFWEKQLAAIEAVLSGRITKDVQSYQIAGRAIVKVPIKELMYLRAIAASNVRKQAVPEQLGEPVYIDFRDESNDANFPPTWVDITGLPGAGQ